MWLTVCTTASSESVTVWSPRACSRASVACMAVRSVCTLPSAVSGARMACSSLFSAGMRVLYCMTVSARAFAWTMPSLMASSRVAKRRHSSTSAICPLAASQRRARTASSLAPALNVASCVAQ